MNRYTLNQWEIITHDHYELKYEESPVKQVAYFYRAPLEATKMVGHLPMALATDGRLESLDSILSSDSKDAIAINLNWFDHQFGNSSPEAVIEHLNQMALKQKFNVSLLGLGDVGSTLAMGLKLLGGDVIQTLNLFDINPAQKSRWEMELNQVVVNPELKVNAIEAEALFESDVFLFCASKFIPKVGESHADVRMMQYADNAALVSIYAKQAREAGFKGLFCVVSDPVDLLCKKAWSSSNTSSDGILDYKGLRPEQVVGFGLGVMDGRAKYYSDQLGLSYRDKGRVFGPHGKDLIVTLDAAEEDPINSLNLTEKVVTANLEMRALGYKPFIAPALSSGADAIVNMLRGKPHYSANFIGGVYWGGLNYRDEFGAKYEHTRIGEVTQARIRTTYERLESLWLELNR